MKEWGAECPGEVDYQEFLLVSSVLSAQVSPALLGSLMQEEDKELDSFMVAVFSGGQIASNNWQHV